MVSASAATSPFAFTVSFLREFAVRDRGHDLHDAAHLLGEVGGHHVYVVGEILPRAGDAGHLRLAAEFAVGADFARDARDFGGEGVELVHHRVDGVLQLENFALHVDRDLARQVAARDGRGDFGDVAHLAVRLPAIALTESVRSFQVPADAGHVGLTTEPAFAADFARHARDFRGERTQLLDHRVERFFELQNFAAHVHGDLAREVAAGDGRRDFRDVAHLAGQVAGHEVHVVGEVLPRAADAGHLGLAAQLPFGADFARHARHFSGERVQLVHHRVDGVLQLENFALHVHRDLARQVAARHRGGHFGDVAHLAVRLPAMELTESVRSFHVPATPGTLA